jgi:hypothetical protein
MREKRQTKAKFDRHLQGSNQIKQIFNKQEEEYERDFEDEYSDDEFEEDNALDRIPEALNETENEEELEKKIASYRNQLEEKTTKINSLRYTIKDATSKINADLMLTKDAPIDEENVDNCSDETPFRYFFDESQELACLIWRKKMKRWRTPIQRSKN